MMDESFCFSKTIELYRELHQMPGIGFDLDETVSFVKRELSSLKIEYTEQSLTIIGDTIPPMTFKLEETTLREGGALVEGNVVEVIYLPTEDGSQPLAERVTADKTYPEALGRWATDKGAQLEIDIELQPHGRIAHNLPDQVMQFERWQITGTEDEIVLYGTLSLPPDWSAYNEARKKDKDTPLPERRARRFSIVATLDKESDSNTESRRILIFKNNGRESKLYFKQ